MRESTFSSFLSHDGNRRAHDLCLAVSRAEPVSPLPLVLVGERGSGKTHLLRSVAHRLRATLGHAAIVMLSPQSKPEEMTRLANDPKPIDMARYAVLLIDDLHGFTGHFDTLTRLIGVFLENDHPIIVASEVHPDRLASLPPPLSRIVHGGQVVQVDGGEAQAAIKVVEAAIRDEQREAIAKLTARVRELEAAGPEGVALDFEESAAANEELQQHLTEAREEIEQLRGEHALLAVAAREAVVLRKKLDDLERERVERATQPAEDSSPQTQELKRNLDEARYDAQKAREEARGMLERAQRLLGELHMSRESYEAAQRDRERQREDIRRFQGLRDDNSAADGSAAPTQAAEAPLAAPAEDPALIAMREELHRLQESLVRARAERDNAKSHLAHIREALDTALADLDQLRTDAAQDAAAHAARVTELEQALVARQSEVERLQAMQRAFTDEVRALQSQVTEGAEVLERLMELFGAGPAQSDDADGPNETEETSPERLAPRADFGDGIRLVSRRGAALHHIEELRGQLASFFPPNLPPLETGDDEASGRAQSA